MFSIPFFAVAFIVLDLFVAILALALCICINYVLYKYSGKILLRWYRAERIGSLNNLSKKAGLSSPDIYVFEHPLPLIFTVGTRGKYDIVLSSEAMDLFDTSELDILFAREIGHIMNGDVPLNTVVALFAGSFSAVSTIALWGSMLMGFGQKNDPCPRLIRLFSMGLVAPFAALLTQLFLPHSREYVADDMAVELTKKSQKLKESLKRLEHSIELKSADVNPGHAHLFPINVLRATDFYDIHLSLFNTHPYLENRFDRLKMGSYNVEVLTDG